MCGYCSYRYHQSIYWIILKTGLIDSHIHTSTINPILEQEHHVQGDIQSGNDNNRLNHTEQPLEHLPYSRFATAGQLPSIFWCHLRTHVHKNWWWIRLQTVFSCCCPCNNASTAIKTLQKSYHTILRCKTISSKKHIPPCRSGVWASTWALYRCLFNEVHGSFRIKNHIIFTIFLVIFFLGSWKQFSTNRPHEAHQCVHARKRTETICWPED